MRPRLDENSSKGVFRQVIDQQDESYRLKEPIVSINRYFLLRHGFSVANEHALIISSPELGLGGYGLTEQGRDEICRCVTEYADELSRLDRIYSSDFLRTFETSQIISEAFAIPVETSPLLRERFFGDWEGSSNTNYELVWQEDLKDAAHCRWNVESVQSVADRMIELTRRLDAVEHDKTFLIVSHGDPLQIMLAATNGTDLRLHRSLDAFGTGQLRQLA